MPLFALYKKGVLSQLETNDLEMSRCTITPGYFESAYVSGTFFGRDMFVRTLDHGSGDAIQFAEIMSQSQAGGDNQIRQNAYQKVLGNSK